MYLSVNSVYEAKKFQLIQHAQFAAPNIPQANGTLPPTAINNGLVITTTSNKKNADPLTCQELD